MSEIKAPEVSSDEGQNMIQKLSQVMSVRRSAIQDDEDEDAAAGGGGGAGGGAVVGGGADVKPDDLV